MKANSSNSGAIIISAIIGLVGTLGTALIHNWPQNRDMDYTAETPAPSPVVAPPTEPGTPVEPVSSPEPIIARPVVGERPEKSLPAKPEVEGVWFMETKSSSGKYLNRYRLTISESLTGLSIEGYKVNSVELGAVSHIKPDDRWNPKLQGRLSLAENESWTLEANGSELDARRKISPLYLHLEYLDGKFIGIVSDRKNGVSSPCVIARGDANDIPDWNAMKIQG